MEGYAHMTVRKGEANMYVDFSKRKLWTREEDDGALETVHNYIVYPTLISRSAGTLAGPT